MWIGGPPAAGKSTIAGRLARRYGLRLYRSDTRTWSHRDRAVAAGHAAARRWEELDAVERWDRPSTELLEMSLHAERGPMVIDDVRALPESPGIIAEGSCLPASICSSGLVERSHLIWLVPTAAFQDRQLAAAATSDGHARLYRRLRQVIEDEARAHDVPTLTVDGSRDVAVMVTAVEAALGPALDSMPRARSRAERQALRRESNEALIAQVRGRYARPWAEGNPEVVAQLFVCECGRLDCQVDVILTVAQAATRAVLAPGHG